jgi:hypothetical protein
LFNISNPTLKELSFNSLILGKNDGMFDKKVKILINEINSLKPYLNKPGKEFLEDIINKDLQFGIIENSTKEKKKFNQLEINKTNQLLQLFLFITNYETGICRLLSHNSAL